MLFSFRPFVTFDADDGVGSGEPVQPEGQGLDTTIETPVVQPEEGQGQQGGSLYDEALSSVPEEHRQYVESHFKEWDRKVSEKLSAAAEDRKALETFDELGIRDRFDQDQLEALVEIADALSDPDSAKELVRQLAEELEVSFADEDAPSDSGIPEIDALRAEIAELREFKDGLTQRDREAEVLEQLQQEYAEVVELNGGPLDPKLEARLGSLAEKFAPHSETPLKDAYAFIGEIAGDAEAGVFRQKATEPTPAEPAGRASTAPEAVDTFADAERLLKQRLQNAL